MFEFKAETLPEGTPDDVIELLNSETIQGQLKSSFDRHFDLQASGLKKTNEALKQEKIKLKEYADSFAEIDPEEYKTLKELSKSKGNEARELERAMAELKSIRESKDAEIAKAAETANEYKTALQNEQLKGYVFDAIGTYNANANLKVQAGAEKYLIEAAKQYFQRDDKGDFIPLDGERVLTGRDGIMKGAEWVDFMRDKEPLFFEKATGSGAMGQRGAGVTGHYNPSALAGNQEERKRAIAAKFNLK